LKIDYLNKNILTVELFTKNNFGIQYAKYYFSNNLCLLAFFYFLKLFIMKKLCTTAFVAVSLILCSNLSYSQEKTSSTMAKATTVTKNTAVETDVVKSQGGTIADIVAGSKSHSTLLVALKSAELVETLKSAGPFTVFAPTNDAFAKIQASALDNLLKPENKEVLTKVLTGHVISGKIKAEDIIAAIKVGNGTATYTTLNGDKLSATTEAGKVKLIDSAGNATFVSTSEILADNGIVHVIDAVLGGK
jgi:uncharacterized surface protein with fasciclin (FAS1) repeats